MGRLVATLAVAAVALLAVPLHPGGGVARAASAERLIASASECPDAGDAGAPPAAQEEAMLCLTNFARRQGGLEELAGVDKLHRSAELKSGDIIRCDSFSHEACGHDMTFWMQRVGFIQSRCRRVGENIAWGTGPYGTPRAVFGAWMRSEGHRDNILGAYAQIGVGLRVGGLDGHGGAHVWTQQFALG